METIQGFPSHNIDPRKKGKDWCLQFSKAAWRDSETGQPKTMFYHYARTYDRIKAYAHGRQDTAQYKKPMHVDEQSNSTTAVLDFKVLPIVKNRRQIALGRLQKSEYNIIATPIDNLAKTDADNYFATLQAKMLMRQELQKQNPRLANSPALSPEPNDPIDMDELQMRMQFGYKHEYAIDVEEGIQLIFNQNDIKRYRDRVFEDLFDFGVAACKDWMEPSGKIRFRNCDVRSIVTNYCRYPNFSDIQYCGEVIDLTWTEFRELANGQFEEDEFEKIFDATRTQVGNDRYSPYTRRNDKFKVKVLDLEWFSVDDQVYAEKQKKDGNTDFFKTTFDATGGNKTSVKRYQRQVVYRAKWIIGTDYIYDFGLAPFQKRDKGLTNTELSFHLFATNFYEMRASGIMEDLIPIADQMAIAWLKLQNIRNSLQPFAWDIDLDSIEDVSLSKGGEVFQPKDIIQMFYQNGVLINRRKGLGPNGTNFKSIEFISTNYGELIAAAWTDYNYHFDLLNRATGFNEATDGSTVNPKNLNSTNAAMQESTNNALYHIQCGEEMLLLELANSVQKRLFRAIKMGKVEGYIQSLGTGTVKFIKVSPDIDLHDYGLMLEDRPSVEDKQMLQTLMAKGMQDGTLDATDMITVQSTQNLKQAEQILAYRIKKRKEEQQQNALQQQQQTGQIQMQSAQAAEQARQSTLQLEYQLKMQLTDREKGWDYKIAELTSAIKAHQTLAQIQSTEKQQDKELGIQPEVAINQTPMPQNMPQQQAPMQPQEQTAS